VIDAYIFTTELEENLTLNADVWKSAGQFGNATFPLDNFYYNNSALLGVIFKYVQETNFEGITVSGRRRETPAGSWNGGRGDQGY